MSYDEDFIFDPQNDDQLCFIQGNQFLDDLLDQNNQLKFECEQLGDMNFQEEFNEISDNLDAVQRLSSTNNFAIEIDSSLINKNQIFNNQYKVEDCTCESRSRSREIEKNTGKIKKWTQDENDLLANLYYQFNGDWQRIVERMSGRTMAQCKQYWQRKHKPEQPQKSKWTPEEDQLILDNINKEENNWAAIATILKNKTGKQIRERYINKLRSDIVDVKKQPWSNSEDQKLLQLYNQLGSKWAQIARHFFGRSDLQIKNRTNKLLKTQSGTQLQQEKPKLQVQDLNLDGYLELDKTCEKSQNKPKFEFPQFNSQTVSSQLIQ
ncbi:unnamed protein product (macronuclear) [Paramecium tetraurelia]|uniref:Uncharacterized protein n=1 Tax=Paramecium tetraurelia TaxID=5888 RepID=A0CKK1_PARTE|nr:uncharacterized protein GSPATT00001032001 [Paramecium tetraurelia]CAK71318.1 unnamed protein product [Paramecium tetraurelia]|eukprot:XP_001438715.1 hypothetical protein (macronuclear) [Paramecium tetraurelia strain d4-2]